MRAFVVFRVRGKDLFVSYLPKTDWKQKENLSLIFEMKLIMYFTVLVRVWAIGFYYQLIVEVLIGTLNFIHFVGSLLLSEFERVKRL